MDRLIVYPGAIPLDTDNLGPQRGIMKAIGWLLQSTMGTSTGVAGLACTPTAPPSLTVNVGPGAIWSLEEVDPNAYGSLAADTSPLMKMGINAEASGTNFTLTAPGTSGQSINYLIEATFLEQDGTPVVLPYVNPSNPATPYSGPSNTGAAQNTIRAEIVSLQLLAGAPANTGSQQTPATTAGWVPLYMITVNYGQSAITAGNITVAPGAPFIGATLPALAWGATLYQDTGTTNALAVTLSPAPASLAALTGVPLRIKVANTTTGAFTIDPNGLGATTVIDQSGNAFTSVTGANAALANDVATFIYNGASFVYHPTTGRLLRTSVYTLVSGTLMVSINGAAPVAASSTYTPSPGTNAVRARVQGGGGGGAGCPAAGSTGAVAGEPGNGGAYGEGWYTSDFDGMTITVGAGGIAGVANVNDGGNGGASSAGTLLSSPGGPGGGQGNVDSGSASGGNGNTSGLPSGANIVSRQGGVGGPSFGFTTGQVGVGGQGGAAGDGGGGAQVNTGNLPGISAISPGAGASGTIGLNNTGIINGAAGASGYVIIEDYA